MTPIYVSWDKREGRIEASLFVASHATIQDSEIGRHEQLRAEFDDESAEAKELDENPFCYEPGDEDEIYTDLFGEKLPRGFYAYFHEGDLFLGAYTDLDAEATQDERDEVWAEFKAQLEAANFAPEWLDDQLTSVSE